MPVATEVVHVREDQWTAISQLLSELESILDRDRDPAVDKVTQLRIDGDLGDRGRALAALTSANMWGHMGSFFDRGLKDRRLNTEFRRALIRLADALESAGVATADVSSHGAILQAVEARLGGGDDTAPTAN